MQLNGYVIRNIKEDLDTRFISNANGIAETDIIINRIEPIGEGHFGKVYKGVYNQQPIALKEFKNWKDFNVKLDFAREVKIMAQIGKHENITTFFGTTTNHDEEGLSMIVLEYAFYGSLESVFKLNHCNRAAWTSEPKLLLYWSYQIARGMAFLEGKNIVHGDLATRNVLVFNPDLVKICDFGFSRQLPNRDFVFKPKRLAIPWQWAAIETLEHSEYSIKTDVWSFGVTLWEIFTFGKTPFSDQVYSLDFGKALRRGMRLPLFGIEVGYAYKTAMVACWMIDPGKRPTFKALQELLST